MSGRIKEVEGSCGCLIGCSMCDKVAWDFDVGLLVSFEQFWG